MSQRVCKSYRVLVGLEIHVQLATRSKMFTAVANGATNFGAEPNSLVDAQVLGLPGVLPVMNKRAVEYSIMVGLALGCKIAKHTKWDRKSYYYPDLPKNYQISQYDMPLCYEGTFDLPLGVPASAGMEPTKTIRIRRAHLEEDAGKLLHDAPGGYKIDHSIVDLNRAGTPLLEIVTEPDFSTPEEVRLFGQELQKIVQFLGVSQAQMQMGQMRFEPNINVHITDANGQVHKTAITEIKNLNSFSVLEKATAYEIQRQLREWEETGSLGRKSTYGWNESTQSTFHQRDKEEANDYRYFPDPDLVPVDVSDDWLNELKYQVGELPAARRKRYLSSSDGLGLSNETASVLTSTKAIGDFFEQTIVFGGKPQRVANLIVTHGLRFSNELGKPLIDVFNPKHISEIAQMLDKDQISAASVPELVNLAVKREHFGSQEIGLFSVAQDRGLIQANDMGPIDAAIDKLIAENPKSLQDFKAGKQQALGSLVGMIMKSGKGMNPKMVQERLRERVTP